MRFKRVKVFSAGQAKVVRSTRLITVLGLSFLSFACATIEIPLPVVTPPHAETKSPQHVGVYFSESFRSESYKSSQVGTTWIYPLGKVLPEVILKSLQENFDRVTTIESMDAPVEDLDYRIEPSLESFRVDVPLTIFSQTKTEVAIGFSVHDQKNDRVVRLDSTCSHLALTEEDEQMYEYLSHQAPQIFAHTPQGVFSASKYEYLAARDAALAILHCVDELNEKLKALGRQ